MEVRRAVEDDIEQVCALQVERNGPECDAMIRALVVDPAVGVECFTVAVDQGRVVSSLCLMAETFVLEGVSIPVGQPEFVATAVGYERRGLIRRQMDLVHAWSQARGDLSQVIGGIPYFYRRFGYEYAIAMPEVRLMLPGSGPAMPEGWSVRKATADDVPTLLALERHAQASALLTSSRAEHWWRWWVQPEAPGDIYLAERDEQIGGSAWIGDGPPGIGAAATGVYHPAARQEAALWALLAEAATRGRPVLVEHRAGLIRAVDPLSAPHPRRRALYVRVPDPVALLDRILPVLAARLARSAFAASSGALLLSTYIACTVLTYRHGVLTIEAVPPVQDIMAKGGASVPPDLIATLIYGRYGANELAARHDDVRLGRPAELMEVLFPRLETDIVTSL